MKGEDRLPPFLTWIPKKALILIHSHRLQEAGGCKTPPSSHLPRVFPKSERNMETGPSEQGSGKFDIQCHRLYKKNYSPKKTRKPWAEWYCQLAITKYLLRIGLSVCLSVTYIRQDSTKIYQCFSIRSLVPQTSGAKTLVFFGETAFNV